MAKKTAKKFIPTKRAKSGKIVKKVISKAAKKPATKKAAKQMPKLVYF